ncbi:DEAD/DEAH box helicase [Solirubrobacter soli]|uniref:DEAD/DEAH box helicase n=1 Tax=Solirubrobacter soli TaxID=363832 RepID=UPI0004133D80|nr:DEAD/DEAH box helicase [Solirubrobacter soli]
MSSQSFAELGLSQPVVRALADRGMKHPFAIQSLVIEDVLDGVDVLAKSPTGSGKTIAFAAPIVDVLERDARRPTALVLAPTRELVSQIVEEARPLAEARGLKVAAVYGGVGFEKQTREAKAAHLLVATPGRLEDLLQRRSLSLSDVEILVLDEADRMLDMGFRPAVDRIVKQCPQDRQTLFFSATLDGEVGRIAADYTVDAVRHEHRPPEEHKAEIEHRFRLVSRDTRVRALVEELRVEDRELALVFVRTKRGADRLVKRLGNEGVRAVAMHGNKSQNQRERALAEFGSGKVDVLVATDVAARGIDVTGVSHVINFDAPDDRESYVHRIGRTGRAGRTGIGITFVEAEQARDMGKIAAALRLHEQFEHAGLGQTPRPHTSGPNTTRHRPRSSGGGRKPRSRASR